MKNVKFLLSAALVFVGATALAQDFRAPQYEKWGDTPEQREKNILNSNFLKESCDNRDYNAAAHYLNELINSVPTASVSFYQRGAVIYKNKINRAKSVAEKNTYIDSLMLMYDLRAKYFGDHPKQGTAFILDQKAREFLRYKPNDRKGIREAFRAAIEAGGDNTDPETVVAYFSNLCDDYKNTDEVLPDEIIAEYDRLTPFFEKNPNANEYKAQFDAAFGLSGAASCENLEKLFRGKLEAAPDDEALLAQAVRNFLKRWSYRAGFRYGTHNQTYNGDKLGQYAVTLGVGVPVKFLAISSIDVGVEYGRRGYNLAERLGLVRQQYFKFSIGFTLFAGSENGEYWFLRPKYD